MEITDQNVKDWLEDIEDARKREKSWKKEGEKIEDIYNGENPDTVPFNILYSNTETLRPALYSNTPRPVVKRRHTKDQSPVVKAAEQAGTRILEYLIDTDIEEYETFDDSMECAVQDAILPGRGCTVVKFDAIMGEEDLKWAYVCTDSMKWKRVYFGYAQKWSNVPWMALEYYLDKKQVTEIAGEEIAKEIKFTDNEEDEETSDTGEKTGRKTAQCYQVWDKDERKVKWISPQYDGYLKEEDDPLGITGFFPMPKPLKMHKKSNDLMPTALYTMYKNQANELNRITTRLNRIIEAVKFRGVYDGNMGDDLERLLDDAEDAVFVPTDKGASLIEGGFDRAIWTMPVEKLIATAQQLMVAREQCKQVIYEITGISDLMRGQTKASETLGAQELKSNWGTMRLKDLQKDVQKYVRETLRIMLDIASQNIPLRFWGDMTGLNLPTQEEKMMAQMQMEQLKMQAQVMQQTGRQAPPPPPELMKAIQSPTWEEVLDVLKDDFTRSYKIDIETNSTLDIEATEDKKEVSEFMNAYAQFLNGIMPMVKEGVMPFGAAKSMLLEISRRFRLGSEVEEEISAMQEPKKQNPEQMKKQAQEFKKAQEKFKKDQEQFKQQIEQEKQKLDQERRKAGDQLDSEARKLEVDKMDFEYQKKLFQKEMELEKKLAEKDRQVQIESAKNEIKNIVEKSKRDTQSMLDKHAANMKSTIPPSQSEKPSINIENIMPDNPKTINIKRDNGMITGADVS